MKTALLAIAAVMSVLSGCSGGTSGPKAPEGVGGYFLVSVNGVSVPGITNQNETIKTEVLSGLFGINADGTFTETRTGRITVGGGTPSIVTTTQSGTWTKTGTQFSFVAGTPSAPINFGASFNAGVLTYTSGGSTLVYQMSLPD